MPHMMGEIVHRAFSDLLPNMPNDGRAEFVSMMTGVLEQQDNAGRLGGKPHGTRKHYRGRLFFLLQIRPIQYWHFNT